MIDLELDLDLVEKKKRPILTNFSEFLEYIKLGFKPFDKQLEMVEFASGDGIRLVLCRRDIGKSHLITCILSLWRAYLYPEKSNLIVANSQSSGRNYMDLITQYMTDFPELWEVDSINLSRIRLKQGLKELNPTIIVKTIRSRLRGSHPDFIVVDDPLTLEESGIANKKLVDLKYAEIVALATRKSSICIIGNPVDYDDLYAKLRASPTVEKIEIWNDDVPLEFRTDLDKLRSQGVSERAIMANYEGKIIGSKSQPFYDIQYANKGDEFNTSSPIFIFVDPAKSVGGDYTALCIGQVQENDTILISGLAIQKSVHLAQNELNNFVEKECKNMPIHDLAMEITGLSYKDLEDFDNFSRASSNMPKFERIYKILPYFINIKFKNNPSNLEFNRQVKTWEALHSSHIYHDAPDSVAWLLQRMELVSFKMTKPISKFY